MKHRLRRSEHVERKGVGIFMVAAEGFCVGAGCIGWLRCETKMRD